jgi:hypothetical protein
MPVNEAFAEFKSQLELPDKKQAKVSEEQKKIRENVARHLDVYDSFLTGSYSRYTKINPLNDIDVFLIRNVSRTGLATSGNGVSPSDALNQVEAAVRKAYPSATVKQQSRSVNTQVPGVEFGFDLVPAWLRSPDGYWIPDTDSGSWLPTDPLAHNALMTAANKASNDVLKPTVKMIKHWNRNNYDLFRSFHLELLCKDMLVGPFATNWFDINVLHLLERLDSLVGVKMTDPIYGVSRVDKPLTSEEQTKLKDRLRADAGRARHARQLEEQGDHAGAIKVWREVFLSGFPS